MSKLSQIYPWIKSPLIVSAPMRIIAGPHLALATSSAGGIGFIGPGASPKHTLDHLKQVEDLLPCSSLSSPTSSSAPLPVGIGCQIWNGDLETTAQAVSMHHPCAVWLFAPRDGQTEIDRWSARLRASSPSLQIWLQVGTIKEALDAVHSPEKPDVLILQGSEAGGHGRSSDSQGTMVLVPEAIDSIRSSLGPSFIPVIAAGGIVDGRGVAAALALGASGVAMGTRMLASSQAIIDKAYQDEVLRAQDGAKFTVRTHLYNHLRGTFGWPVAWAPRTLVNSSWTDHQAGVPFDELKRRHDQAADQGGEAAWGPEGRLATYVGAGVGLVRKVDDAQAIVNIVRDEAKAIFRSLMEDI